jgi:integrase
MKLSKATIAKLKLPPGKIDHVVFDAELKGFGVRLRAGGKRTWIAQYRVGAKQRRVTLGTVNIPEGSGTLDAEQARDAASKKLAEVTLGGDPQADKFAERAKAAKTLGAVIDTYLAARQAAWRPKSFSEIERYLRKSWRPLHGLPVHKIERRDVAARVAKIATENGPIAATRARAALSAMLAWAMREGLTEQNVVIGTNRPAEPRTRARVLSTAELASIWNACRDDDYGRIIRLLILTGQRRNEVGGMAWSELDFDQGTWRIPGDRTKNKRQHTIALPPMALAILRSTERHDDDARVFGRRDAGFGGWSKAKAALDRRMTKPVVPWTVHDIRRSVATHMAELGVLPHVIEALLNHISGHKGGVAGVYNRAVYERETHAALALWADHIRSVIGGGERKIVPFAHGGVA